MARLPAHYRERLVQSIAGDPTACAEFSAIPQTEETQRCSQILMYLAAASLQNRAGSRIAVSAKLLPPLP